MSDNAQPMGFDVTSIAAVSAVPEKGQLIVLFNTKEDGQIAAVLPSELVGNMIAVIAAEHQRLALTKSDTQGVLMPMGLTGIRASEVGKTGAPVLLLQLDRVFELALLPSPEVLDRLESVAKSLREPPKAERPKLQ